MDVNIALLSGEMSGDVVGGALAGELRRLRPDVALWGMGSRRMEEAGVELLHDSAEWSAIGVVEALKVYPPLRFKVYPHLLQEIKRRKPSVVILIDFGAFNMRIAEKCRTMGVRTLYYFPPGSWRRGGKASGKLVQATDRIATPFPWSEERLKKGGANAEFVGHPLLELAQPTMTRAAFAEKFGMEPGHPIIGLLPGSRKFEVWHNTPAMLSAARLITRQIPNAQFVFGLAPNVPLRYFEMHFLHEQRRADWLTRFKKERADLRADVEAMEGRHDTREPQLVTPEGVQVPASFLERSEFARRLGRKFEMPAIVLAEGLTYDVMAHSDALVVCSGTATLEAAILGTPMVILYRGSRLMEMEYKLRRVNKLPFIGMPNIIADRQIVPELIQRDATPENLAEHILSLLRDPAVRASMKAELAKVRGALGTPGASARVAKMALEMADLLPGTDRQISVP